MPLTPGTMDQQRDDDGDDDDERGPSADHDMGSLGSEMVQGSCASSPSADDDDAYDYATKYFAWG